MTFHPPHTPVGPVPMTLDEAVFMQAMCLEILGEVPPGTIRKALTSKGARSVEKLRDKLDALTKGMLDLD